MAMTRLECSHEFRRDEGWLRYLRERQLTEELGWRPEDEAYGGWSYAQDRPRPVGWQAGDTPLAAPNLSATPLFAP